MKLALAVLLAVAVAHATGDGWLDKHTPLHVLGSAGTMGGLYALGRVCRMSKRDALLTGVAGATLAGVGVECWQQWSGRGRVSGKDLAVNALGTGLTAAGIVMRWMR